MPVLRRTPAIFWRRSVTFTILASGSEGNAALLTTDTTRLLIDCGLSAKELTRRMAQIDQPPLGAPDGDAILLSHAHSDHGGSLGVVLNGVKKRGGIVPIYCTAGCFSRLDFGRIERPDWRQVVAGLQFTVGDIAVYPFTTPHDDPDPVSFVFMVGGVKIGFAVDLGFIPPFMVRQFSDCHIIVLESNYDAGMLESGSYTQELKDRISGPMGHLSNDQVGEYLATEKPKAITVVLTHLSQENNTVQIAEWSARRALLRAGSDARLLVASQSEVLKVWGYE